MQPANHADRLVNNQFQSSPGLETGCNFPSNGGRSPILTFQSSPGLETGCNSPRRPVSQHAGDVSILTRSGDRVQPTWPRTSRCITSFNPHPVWRPGATRGHSRDPQPRPCFNPHPVWRPGATVEFCSYATLSGGFNPHPVWRPGATAYQRFRLNPTPEFQSSPGLETGCNPSWPVLPTRSMRFNPHPVWRPGATSCRARASAEPACFNPHPVWRPGATTMRIKTNDPLVAFQSSPGLETGCNPPIPAHRSMTGCFNPHPVWRPGATRKRCELPLSPGVSILTRSGDRVQLRPRSAGRRNTSFNPHPVWRPGATVPPAGFGTARGRQSLIDCSKAGLPAAKLGFQPCISPIVVQFPRETHGIWQATDGSRRSQHQRIVNVVLGALSHDL